MGNLWRRAIAAKVVDAPPSPYEPPATDWPGEAKSRTEIPRFQGLDEDLAPERINVSGTENTTFPALDPDPNSAGAELLDPLEASPGNLDFSTDKVGTKEPNSQSPREIPGRRSGQTQLTKPVVDRGRDSTEPPTPSSRPILTCREPPGSQQWEVILSTDKETGIVTVTQNGVQLKKSNGEWPLSTFTGRLSVEFEDGSASDVPLFDGSPLIFKVSNGWKGNGHKVRHLTYGHFILLAPKAWERLGHVPVEPAGCSDQEFMAHFFFRGSSDTAEEIGGFLDHEVSLGASCFDLTGELVFDDSDEGSLFVGTPPQLNPSNTVSWARVGEEGRNGWKGENFRPSERTLAEVLDGRQGRFFVRVYEDGPQLLDSDQFRHLRNLKMILVDNAPYNQRTLVVPNSSGHRSTEVKFVGADGAAIRPIVLTETPYVEQSDSNLVLHPHPDADTLSCDLKADGGIVRVELNLPRVWWRLEEMGQGESDGEWHDTPLEMARHEFQQYADKNFALRLRLPERIKSISVGFDDEIDRSYPSSIQGVEIRLDYFRDYEQIDCHLPADALFNTRIEEEILTLIRVSSDPESPNISVYPKDPPVPNRPKTGGRKQRTSRPNYPKDEWLGKLFPTYQ